MNILTAAPKSKQLADILEDEIIGGKLPPDSRLYSIRTLRDKFSVDINVVRGAFNILEEKKLIHMEHGRGSFVNKIPESVYKKSSDTPRNELSGKRVSAKKTVIFADDWHDMTHPACACFLQGVMGGGDRHGIRVQVNLLTRGGNFKELNPSLWKEIVEEDADGLIIPWINEDICREIRKVNPRLAIVSTLSRLPDSRLASVMFDMRSAGFQAMRHLLENGARKILVTTPNNMDFVAGCEDALEDRRATHVKLQHEIVKMEDDMESLALRIAANPPDGMAFSDDRMACKVLKACEKIIPHFWKKTKVASHANIGESLFPAHVTRIFLDSRELGEAVMNSMAALLDDRPGANSVVLIKPKLVE